MKHPNHLAKLLGLLCISLLVSVSSLRAQAPNSAKDPFTLKYIDRPSAETPAPWGLVLGVRPGLAGPFGYSGDLFYDCWSVGYHSVQYGNTIRVGLRSMGRDQAPSSFIEYGSHTLDSVDNSENSLQDTSISYNFVGIGISKMIGYTGKGVTTGFGLGAHAGLPFGDASGFYVGADLSFGVRVPISAMALTLEILASGTFISAGPGASTDASFNSRSGSDTPAAFAKFFGLNAKYAFNFDSN